MKTRAVQLNAQLIQYMLIALSLVVIGCIVWIFITANSMLAAKAIEVDHAKIDAELAQEEISRLKLLKKTLSDDKEIIEKARRIVAESQMYKFQDQVIDEITVYAQKAGIDVIGYDFTVKGTSSQKSTTTSSKLPQKTIVTVKTASNVSYTSYLKFLKYIENNVTKMQMAGIAIKPVVIDPNRLDSTILELEIFLR